MYMHSITLSHSLSFCVIEIPGLMLPSIKMFPSSLDWYSEEEEAESDLVSDEEKLDPCIVALKSSLSFYSLYSCRNGQKMCRTGFQTLFDGLPITLFKQIDAFRSTALPDTWCSTRTWVSAGWVEWDRCSAQENVVRGKNKQTENGVKPAWVLVHTCSPARVSASPSSVSSPPALAPHPSSPSVPLRMSGWLTICHE